MGSTASVNQNSEKEVELNVDPTVNKFSTSAIVVDDFTTLKHEVDSIKSDELILCLNASSLCTLVYKNSVRNINNKDYESENIQSIGISDYKVWTYADNFETVLKNLVQKPAVSAQFTTGLLCRLETDTPVPFICFGGTISLYEVIADLSSVINCESKTLKGEVIGTTGFGIRTVYETFRAFGIIELITNLIKKHNSGLLITGHSLGGAVSVLFFCELLIDYPELFENNRIYIVTFGAPRVLTSESILRIQSLMQKMPLLKFIRIVNKHDIITMLPPVKIGADLHHFGDVVYMGKRDIEVHSGTFPRDRDNWLDVMRKFLVTNATAHQMNSDGGYLPRLIALFSTKKQLDLKQRKIFNRFARFSSRRDIQKIIDEAENDYSKVKHDFISHFFDAPDKSVECKIWSKLSHPNFTYPENAFAAHGSKKDIGISVCGDNLAGACFALGWLRALHENGILKMAKYLSSTGSASWVHVPMTFDQNEHLLSDFLGPYLSPECCTIAAVEGSISTCHGKLLANNNIWSDKVKIGMLNISSSLFRYDRGIDVWSKTVGTTFLEPYGIDSSASNLPALSGDHANRVKDLTTGWVDSVRATRAGADHPFPIVNAGVFIGSARGFLPVEFTPLYYGIIPYHEFDHFHGIGGCLIEPHGFTSKPVEFELGKELLNMDPDAGVFSISVDNMPRPKFVLTTQEILGITSSNMATNVDPLSSDNSFDELYYPTFPTFSSECPGDHFASREQFVDGKYSDYTGIIALLRRKCKFIIACIAADVDVLSDDVENAKVSNLGNLSGLFGRQRSGKNVNGVNDDVFNSQRQVFPCEAWDNLLAALRSNRNSGKPLVHRMTLDVLPNPMVVVPGMHSATVVFCISGECKQWTDALPEEMQKRLIEDNAEPLSFLEEQAVQLGLADSNLNKFPFVPKDRKVLSSLTAGLLTQLAAFQLLDSDAALNIDL